MALSIPITGIGQDYKVPGGFAEILYGQGPASAFAPGRSAVLCMPMLTTGTWTVNTLYKVRNEGDAETGGGPGSVIHRGARAYLKVNKDSELWALPYAAVAETDSVQATCALTFTDTATAPGTIDVYVAGELCSYSFATGATITGIGDGVVGAVNARTWLPVTAANADGVVTLTAKTAGASQGTASVASIRVHAEISSGVTTTVTADGAFLGTGTPGADGSASEVTNLTTALAVIDSVRLYYVVTSIVDTTGFDALVTHLTAKSTPKSGRRSVGIGAYSGVLADAITLATAENYERLTIAWQPSAETDPATLAATLAAVRQQKEATDSAYNFDGTGLSRWIPRQYTADLYPDNDDVNDAINGGLSPIASGPSGTYLVMSLNTRSKNSAGTVNDFRATETHRISVTDEFVDEELDDFAKNYAGKKLEADELLADGSPNPNQKLKRGVIRPSTFAPHIGARMERYSDDAKLQDLDASKESLRVVKTGSRLESGFDLHVIDHLHQATYRVAEVSEG